tara:strand:+ start:1581 stop:1934 length:354 start_codon:yes stop_codon:yes gene_type:complete
MNALIAVSSELISKSISNCLIHIEHSYSIAHSFSDAALMYESTQPDIVIAELTMVNEQQINLRQLIRNQFHAHTPILMTGSISKHNALLLEVEQGANAFICFPIQKEVFLEKYLSLI